MKSDLLIREPQSIEEMELVFDLRWRVLRAPWHQPRGSERDSLEDRSRHVLAVSLEGRLCGVGRVHWNSPDEAQIRYMAVDPVDAGKDVGSRILLALEAIAREGGALRMVLNARQTAVSFYSKWAYADIAEAETLFGCVPHRRMEKRLQ